MTKRTRILKVLLYICSVFILLILLCFIDSIRESLGLENRLLWGLLASQVFVVLGIIYELNTIKNKVSNPITQKATFLKVIHLCSGFVIGYYIYYLIISPSKPFIVDQNHFMFWGILISQIVIVSLAFVLLKNSKSSDK